MVRLSGGRSTLLAKQKGFGQEDRFEVGFSMTTPTSRPQPGELVFLNRVGGNVSPDPAAKRAQMETTTAIARPADAVYRDLEAHNQAQAQLQMQEQTRMLTQQADQASKTPDDPSRGGPIMR